MRRPSFILVRVLALAVSLALLWVAPVSGATWTDQPDYAPGSDVTISGDNSNGAGYLPGETVHVDVAGPNGWTAACDGVVDDGGAWSCQITLDPDPAVANGTYQYTATGLQSGTTETGSFTDAGVQIRAAIPGPAYIAVTFEGDGVGGDPDDIVTWTNADCTGTVDKTLTADEVTNTNGTYDNADGMSNIGSIEVNAPSPVTDGTNTYVFDSWSVSNGAPIDANANPGCIVATSTEATTFITANYVLAGDPDLTADKTHSTDFINVGGTFEWSIRVENEGDADAEFAENDLLLEDDLPAGPTYDNIVVDDSNVSTGDVDCDITSNQLTCWADGGAVTLEPGDFFDVTFDVEPTLGQLGALDNPASGGVCAADPDDVVDEGDDEDNNDCSDSVGVTGIVVTRGACTFDYDTGTDPETFRLIYTPDMNTSSYKLNASNPGQMFLNVVTFTTGDEIDIEIPYPFVTQGATPVHVYGDWTTTMTDGKWCLEPSDQLWTQQTQIEFDEYGDFGDSQTLTVDPDGFEGWVFIRVHIDYGLKGMTTGCARDEDDATGCEPVGTILDGQEYEFSFSDDTSGSTTIESQNEFKRINGVAGLLVSATGDPVGGSTVQIWQGTKLWKTVVTDEDGWYMALFKYTGKATTFTVKWVDLGVQASVTLKSNGFAMANYIEGVSDVSIITSTSTDTSSGDSGGTQSGGGSGGGGKGGGPKK